MSKKKKRQDEKSSNESRLGTIAIITAILNLLQGLVGLINKLLD